MTLPRALLSTLIALSAGAALAAPRPNILFVLCDDLGYGDVGVFFQNQRALAAQRGEPWHFTPQLDALAADGLRLPHHYCPAPVCAPSRASLLTGVHQGHAHVRDNQFDKALEDNHTLATLLRSAGYATACIGKWGLQGTGTGPATWPAYPLHRGFDFFHGYVRHGDGHEHYPKEGPYRGAKEVWEMNTEISAGLDKCYSTDLFTARAKKWMVDHRAAHPDQPFFLYLPYATPHAALEYPTQAYPAGGGLSGGLQWTGTPGAMINTASGTIDSYVHPDYANATYDHDNNSGTAEVAWPPVYKRYATAVRRLDDALGDLRQTVADLGLADDTLIVFTTDNGPSNEDYLTPPAGFRPDFFNSFGPFDGMKRDCWEGGVRVGALVHWPGGIVNPGRASPTPSSFVDWLPTFCDLAGLPVPARADGTSLAPTLADSPQPSPPVYIEYFQNGTTATYGEFLASRRGRARNQMQLLRLGDHVGVRVNVQSHLDDFEIYDVVADPGQRVNLAAGLPALQRRMKDTVLRLRRPGGGVTRPYDGEAVPALPDPVGAQPGVRWQAFAPSVGHLPRLDGQSVLAEGGAARPDPALVTAPAGSALRFSGWITVPTAGDYTFHLASSTRAFLRLHEAAVIDADFGYGAGEERSGAIRLAAGTHAWTIHTLLATNGISSLALDWSGPGIPRQPVPAAAFAWGGTVNSRPVAVEDQARTPRDTPVNVSVLSNDLDDGDPAPLSLVAVQTPARGTTAMQGSAVQFTPAPGFLGEASFGYTITDGLDFATGTVRVAVTYADGDLWFPFDQLTGSLTWEAGGATSATLQGFGPHPWVAGRHGAALVFDGVDDAVVINDFTGITGTQSRTTAAWVRTTASGNLPVLSWGANTAGNKWILLLSSGQPRVEITQGWVQAATTIHDGQWHHLACTFANDGSPDATDVKLYIDGALVTSLASTDPQSLNTSAGVARIGADMQARYFQGEIDDVRIYRRALSAAEITALAGPQPAAALAWHRRHLGDAPVDWLADDDGDGFNRLTEFALGGQPFWPDPRLRGEAYLIGGRLRWDTLRLRAPLHGLLYDYQAALDLSDWSVPAAEVGATPIDDRREQVTVEAQPTDPDAAPVYLRQRITLPWSPRARGVERGFTARAARREPVGPGSSGFRRPRSHRGAVRPGRRGGRSPGCRPDGGPGGRPRAGWPDGGKRWPGSGRFPSPARSPRGVQTEGTAAGAAELLGLFWTTC
jgi:arylsulfatase A-like enzyme